MDDADKDARIIWEYMLMHHVLKPMDAIFALGSNDTRVAERAAELYHQGYAPYVIFAGANGKASTLSKPEAEAFADVAVALGVPEDRIIKEPRSMNTGENVLFVRRLLKEKGLDLNSFILVQKPYMERRTYATFRKQWPEADCIVTSPDVSYDAYIADEQYNGRGMIDVMVGDLQRIKIYPAKGFQIPQEIPADVWSAYERLVALGYTKYFIATS
jgi:uncharacterized SAM-binding protein YcdF (DUF218 family)